MESGTAPALGELEAVREKLLDKIAQADRGLFDLKPNELLTLRSALFHIEQLIQEIRSCD